MKIEIKNITDKEILVKNDETNLSFVLKPTEKADTDFKYIEIKQKNDKGEWV